LVNNADNLNFLDKKCEFFIYLHNWISLKKRIKEWKWSINLFDISRGGRTISMTDDTDPGDAPKGCLKWTNGWQKEKTIDSTVVEKCSFLFLRWSNLRWWLWFSSKKRSLFKLDCIFTTICFTSFNKLINIWIKVTFRYKNHYEWNKNTIAHGLLLFWLF